MTEAQNKIYAMDNEGRKEKKIETAYMVFEELKKRSLTVPECVVLTGFVYGTAYEYLHRLVELGVADESKKGRFKVYRWNGKELEKFTPRNKPEVKKSESPDLPNNLLGLMGYPTKQLKALVGAE